MPANRVVARYRDGRVVKGSTVDFSPIRDLFHIASEAGMHAVRHRDLKAIFFVKDLEGDAKHQKSNIFAPDGPVIGRKITVEFVDGETLVGTTQGYRSDRPGFFLVPADHAGNIERCYVITAATREVRMS